MATAPSTRPITPQVERLEGAADLAALFPRFRSAPYPLLLDGAMPHPPSGRYSYLTADPFLVLRCRGRRIYMERDGRCEEAEGDPLVLLLNLLRSYATSSLPGLPPFQGGAAGYMGYDLGRLLERLPVLAADDLELPDLCLAFYDWVLARDSLEAEEQRIEAQTIETRNRIEETAADKAREDALVGDAEAALSRLKEEGDRINTPTEGEEDALADAAKTLVAANTAVDVLDAKLTAQTEQLVNDEARRTALEHKIIDLKNRTERLQTRLRVITGQRDELLNEAPEASDLDAAQQHLDDARATLDQARNTADAAEQNRTEAITKTNTAATGSHAAAATATRLQAEVGALSDVLNAEDQEQWPPVFNALGVEEGYEAALATALGEDLTASDNAAAPSHWRTMSAMDNPPALPTGALPLSDFVRAPEALGRRLTQIGLKEQYPGTTNPFPWMSEIMDLKKEKNFFETKVTEYQTGGGLKWD